MIICRQCGQQAREGDDFCDSCGAYLEWEGERVDPAAPAGSPGAASPSPGAGAGGDAPPAGRTPPAGGPGPVASPSPGPPAGPWVDMPPEGAPAWTVGPPAAGQPAPAPWADVAPSAVPPGMGPPAPGPPPTPVRSESAPATVMCLECGASNTGERRFCRRCGSSLELVALAGRSDPGAAPTAPVPAPGPGVGLEGPVPPAGPPATARAPGVAVPDAPRIVARTPATAEPARGLKPAEPVARPPATRPPSPLPDVAPGGPICSQCGTANAPGRRFCRRCGASVAGDLPAESDSLPMPSSRPGWWQRVKAKVRREPSEGFSASDSARSAYRHSLDVRYRFYRVLAIVAGAGILAGSLGFTGYSPVEGAKGLWNKAFPRDKRVGELQANADPDQGIDNNFAPGAAVDNDPKTAWSAGWTLAPDDDPAEACAEEPTFGGADHALIVTMPEPSRISKLSVQPGLPADDPERSRQWRPTKLELRFDDGSCKQVGLDDQAGFQDHRLKTPVTKHIRIAILDAAQPRDEAADASKVTIGEVRVYRPR